MVDTEGLGRSEILVCFGGLPLFFLTVPPCLSSVSLRTCAGSSSTGSSSCFSFTSRPDLENIGLNKSQFTPLCLEFFFWKGFLTSGKKALSFSCNGTICDVEQTKEYDLSSFSFSSTRHSFSTVFKKAFLEPGIAFNNASDKLASTLENTCKIRKRTTKAFQTFVGKEMRPAKNVSCSHPGCSGRLLFTHAVLGQPNKDKHVTTKITAVLMITSANTFEVL